MEIIKLLLSIPARLSKEILEKLKFLKKRNKTMKKVKPSNKPLYAQVLIPKINDILKIKEYYLNLLAKNQRHI